jgi:cytochrome c553
MHWTLLLASCASTHAPPEPAAASAPTAEVSHMAEHLARATATRDAVVRGHFDEAREGFLWLATHEGDGTLPEAWLGELREVAQQGVDATNSQDQAMALGALANACGACHETLSTGPVLRELPAPSTGQGVQVHMAQHAWANDRMWAALVEPSSASWERSLRVLGAEPLPADEALAWGLPEGAEEMDQAVHDLAHAALSDDNPDTRADLYGQIVGQCASCHKAAREASAR